MAFKKAVKTKAKLRVALAGVSGAGKTYSALTMAKALGGRVALIDSERSSALLYADKFEFDHMDLSDHGIDRYKSAIREAAAYDVLIIDSLSHEWAGRGGALEEVDRKKGAGNSFAAWNGVSQKHAGLLDDILLHPGHVIVTMRKKSAFVLETVNGKQVPRKVGMEVVQRDGIEFEFTVLLSMEREGQVLIEKSRCSALEEMGALRREDLAKAGDTLREWLATGVDAPAKDLVDREAGVLRGLIQVAASRAELDALTERLKALPETERDVLRPLFQTRLGEVTLGAAPARPTPPNVIDSTATVEPSERTVLEAAVATANSEAELTALVERITRLAASDKAKVRAAWGARRDELRNAALAMAAVVPEQTEAVPS
jgi:phage host-nuclease inhibitor protein Gam